MPFNPAGGGIYNYYGDMVIEGSTIQKNKATSEGGGIISIYSQILMDIEMEQD